MEEALEADKDDNDDNAPLFAPLISSIQLEKDLDMVGGP